MRLRLPSSSYAPPAGELEWSREMFYEQPVVVLSDVRDPIQMARHVADHVTSQSPFFVMDVAAIEQRLDAWREGLPRVKSLFPVKCNADPVLSRILAKNEDVVFEVADIQELTLAKQHVEPSRIVLNTPVLTRKSIRLAGEAGCGAIIIENEKQLNDAVSYAPQSELLLAVTVGSSSGIIPFGCPPEQVCEIFEMARILDARLTGISFELGPLANATTYYQAMAETRRLFDVAKQMGISMSRIGMGTLSITRDVTSIDYIKLCTSIDGALNELFPPYAFPDIFVFANAGSFLVTNAFLLCTNVIGKQERHARDITKDDFDDGIGFIYQINEGVYGSFGCRQMDVNPLCKPLRASDASEDSEPQHFGTIVGPTLDGIDVAQKLLRCRQLSIGEWLLWEEMGAFTIPVDSETPTPPVYYYTGRDCWERLINKERRRSSSPFGDGGSVGGSDCEDYASSDAESMQCDLAEYCDFF